VFKACAGELEKGGMTKLDTMVLQVLESILVIG
jgi:hypothetical protein